MKQAIVILAVVLVMCGVSLAGDPNSMEKPTAGNPVTVSTELLEGKDFGYVTVTLYATKDAIDVANKPDFIKMVKSRWLRPFTDRVLRYRIAKMIAIHKGDSIAALEAQAAAAKVE